MSNIKTDKELLVVFRVLLGELRAGIKQGRRIIFPPGGIVLPEDKEISGKKHFRFEPVEDRDIDTKEVLRQLGVTLYHLSTGRSEHNRESYILDGYQRPLKSRLWPVISALLNGEVETAEKVEEMLTDKDLLKAVAENNHNPGETTTANHNESSEDLLVKLSGEIKVVNADQTAQAWQVPVPENVRLRYSEATIRECIEANRQGEDWRLVYILGLSLREQRDKQGVDQNSQPCFYNNDWWLESKEDSWAKHKPEPGYYLVNFNGKHANKNWQDQENGITALGERFERCHETVFGEAIVSVYLTGGGERIAENWYHWGLSLGSDRNRVFVGVFDSVGFHVGLASPDYSHSILRVCVARKFDS